MSLLAQFNIGFIGAGNMTQAIAGALVESAKVKAENIYLTNRNEAKLKRVVEQLGVRSLNTNEELVDKCEIVIVGVKPQDFVSCMEPLGTSFHEKQILISLAAGIRLQAIKQIVTGTKRIVRVMTNTPAAIGSGVTGYCADHIDEGMSGVVEDIFSQVGSVIALDEGESFQAFTVAASSGIGFVFELMQYWQEWLEEYDFGSEEARKIVVDTFLGAAKLASEKVNIDLDELSKKVTSKKGVTDAGLASMRELEIERLLRYSFEKAVMRDKDLAKNFES